MMSYLNWLWSCGEALLLHVPWNLRVITKAANVRKHARFGDDDVIGFLQSKDTKLSTELIS